MDEKNGIMDEEKNEKDNGMKMAEAASAEQDGAGKPAERNAEAGRFGADGAGKPAERSAEAGRFGADGAGKPAKQSGRKRPARGFLAGLAAGFLAGVVITGGAAAYFVSADGIRISRADSNSALNTASVSKLEALEQRIAQNYYYADDVTTEQKETGLYKGLVESLGDPYSEYYDAEERRKLEESTEGSYYGIGAYVGSDEKTGYPVLYKVIEDSPAQKAGLEDGDLLVRVDGESVRSVDLDEVVSKIRGEEGTTVDLTIYRDGQDGYLNITVTRGKVDTTTAAGRILEGTDHIGYIAISEFDEVTSEQFSKALSDLNGEGMKGLILDLRDNPGGNVSTVVKIAEQLLPKGLVFYYEEKNGTRTEFKATGKHAFTKPLVVLVNGYSASASEILSGAIQDAGIGTILGTQTYGKGVVQSIYDLKDGTALKITTAAYFTRNGHDINHKGITPDVELAFDTDAYRKDGTDNQLEKAESLIEEKLK